MNSIRINQTIDASALLRRLDQRIEAKRQEASLRGLLRFKKPGRNHPAPTLARATEDVAVNALGTFQLLKNTPGSLADGTGTRDAYALCAISSGDTVRLDSYVGENSGGFWAASKCGEAASDGSIDCEVLFYLERLTTLTSHSNSTYMTGTTMQEKIDAMLEAAQCVGFVACTHCEDSEMPEELQLNLAGIEAVAGTDPSTAQREYFADFANGQHTIPMTGCEGQIEEENGSYTLRITLTKLSDGVDTFWSVGLAVFDTATMATNYGGISIAGKALSGGGKDPVGTSPLVIASCKDAVTADYDGSWILSGGFPTVLFSADQATFSVSIGS